MLRTTQNHQAGFMLAPLLYMLALGGIGAAVMFSGYSQVLRSNAEMTSVNAVRQQLSTAAQTLSASSQLTSGNTILTPPGVTTFAAVTDTARLPTSYATVNATGTPTSYGVLDTATGVRQLDPWGKYYVYCKWDSAIATGTNPSISIISSGPDGTLQTKCGDNAAVGDDRINKLSVAEAVNRANVWQVNTSSQVQFGNTSSAVKVDSTGNMNVDSLAVGTGATATSGNIYANGNVRGATVTSAGALTAGSASVTGALSAGSISTAGTLSAGATTASTLTAFRVFGGGGVVSTWANVSGNAIAADTTVYSYGRVCAGNGSGNCNAVGGTGVVLESTGSNQYSATYLSGGGTSYFTAGNVGIGTKTPGYLLDVNGALNAGATTVTTLTASGAASAASLTLGTPLAVAQGGTGATTAAAARTNLGEGTMSVQNANAVAITGGSISGVTFSGSGGGITAGTIPISSLAGYPGSSAVYLRGDGAWAAVTTSQWTTNAPHIYYNTGNVGIGTSGPGYLLQVVGNVNGSYVGAFTNAATHGLYAQATNYGVVATATSAGGLGVQGVNSSTGAWGALGYGYNGAYGVSTTASGHGVVGANTSGTSASYGVYGYSGTYYGALGRADGYAYVGNGTLYNNGAIQQVSAGDSYFTGNLGVGTASPGQKLDVNGYIQVRSINGEGGTIKLLGNNGVNMHLENINGTFRLVNSAWSLGLYDVDQSGNSHQIGGQYINNGSPTIYLQDTDQLSAMVHNNSNLVYILRGCGANSTSWCTVNGWWPVYWNLTNNDMVSGGNIYAFNFYHNSDERLKKDIKPLQNSLDTISKLKGVSYTWKSNGDKSLGLIAQDVEKVLPMIVKETKEGFKSVDYEALIGPLVEAVKELKGMFDKIGDKFAQIFSRMDASDTQAKLLKDEVKTLSEELKLLHGEFTKYKSAHP